jgi:hypothetical protein
MSDITLSPAAVYSALTDFQKMVMPAHFTAASIVAATADVNMLVGGFIGAGRFTFPSNGRLIGFSRENGPAISAGSITIFALKEGVQSGNVVLNSGSRSYQAFSSPISFLANERLNFQYTTDALFAGTSSIIVFPFVVFDV